MADLTTADTSAYRDANRFKFSCDLSWENFRFVCIDSETTGLDVRRDRLITLAGIGCNLQEICLWDQHFVMMPVAYNTAAVTIHGITREEAASGVEEPLAVAGFLNWLRDGVIVGHHIQHDITMLNLACERHYGWRMSNLVVDTLEVFHAIISAGGFTRREPPLANSLDALCDYFGIVPHDRHTAAGDAFLTALIFARLLKEASRLGLWSFQNLHAWHADRPVRDAYGH
jgi:DNA polymerase-3 subunit epsilon